MDTHLVMGLYEEPHRASTYISQFFIGMLQNR
uniref:Transposase n=1 Tax=Heterorhabditis bacteriophora TaxID=37862 RepID=A0A1I7WAG5_HETBA